MAGEQRHTAEHTIVVADQFVKILIVPSITGIETEARDLRTSV
jgi:hypothetical protein